MEDVHLACWHSSEVNSPASFGGLSKTWRPVHREACQNLLGDASDAGGSIPAEVWGQQSRDNAACSALWELAEPPALPQLAGHSAGCWHKNQLPRAPGGSCSAATAPHKLHVPPQRRRSCPHLPTAGSEGSALLGAISSMDPLILSVIFSKSKATHSTGSECVQHCLCGIFLEVGIKHICWVPNLLFFEKYTCKWKMTPWIYLYRWVLMGALYAPTAAYMRRNKHPHICFDFCNILPPSFILWDQNETQSCERSTIRHWKNKRLFSKFIGTQNPLCTHGASSKQPENNIVS